MYYRDVYNAITLNSRLTSHRTLAFSPFKQKHNNPTYHLSTAKYDKINF